MCYFINLVTYKYLFLTGSYHKTFASHGNITSIFSVHSSQFTNIQKSNKTHNTYVLYNHQTTAIVQALKTHAGCFVKVTKCSLPAAVLITLLLPEIKKLN